VKPNPKLSQFMNRLGYQFQNVELLSEALTHSSLSSQTRRDNQRLECAEVANEIRLGDALLLGRSEMLSGGRRKQALLGDAMEAVIAAIYTDAGFETARDAVLRLWGTRLENAQAAARDGKTMLQEWAQARGMKPPTYAEIGRSGPDHAPIFTVSVTLDNGETAQAQASSKRAAQQAAADKLFDELPHD